jgi:hypothetical protein
MEVPIVPKACPEAVEGFNRCAPFKPFGIQEIDFDFLDQIPTRCLVLDE